MTRRRRNAGSAAAQAEAENEDKDKSERIAVFEKTKMCKFHILGVCMKGDNCRFAHEKTQLQALPDLQRTKLCKTLINTGQCDNPQCKYAHNKEELRPLPEAEQGRQKNISVSAGLPAAPGSTGNPAAPGSVSIPGMPAGADPASLAVLAGLNNPSGNTQTAQAAQEAAALFRPGGPLAHYGQPLQDMPMNQKQAAIQQMGQVAQAHAAEAARLHAMALFLHAHANGNGGTPDQGAINQFLASQGQGQGQGAEKSQQSGDGAQGAKWANGADGSDLAAAMMRTLSNEPVQINTDSLRSMSSTSLSNMVQDNDAEPLPGDSDDHVQSPSTAKHVLTYSSSAQVNTPSPDRRNSGSGAAGKDGPDAAAALAQAFTSVNDVMTVKNTFLDFGPHVPTSQVLRSVQTASGRLDLMSQE